MGSSAHPSNQSCSSGSTRPLKWPEGRVMSLRDEDMGHISTRQILKLLDGVAESAGLQEMRPGKMRQPKRITPHLLRHSFSRWSLETRMVASHKQSHLATRELFAGTLIKFMYFDCIQIFYNRHMFYFLLADYMQDMCLIHLCS